MQKKAFGRFKRGSCRNDCLTCGCPKLSDIPSVKSLKGGKKANNAYRMRLKDHRICFYFEDQIIELVRVLPRKDVYKVFP